MKKEDPKEKKGSTVDNQLSRNVSDHVLACIRAGLPNGYTATNKTAVMKQKGYDSPAYTSWAKDAQGNRYLAVLKSDNKVKLVPECDAGGYRNVR